MSIFNFYIKIISTLIKILNNYYTYAPIVLLLYNDWAQQINNIFKIMKKKERDLPPF